MLLAKILSTMVAVLGLAAIAERAGPALAGTLAGIPLGVAIVFFFVGLEQGPYFVTDAAPYTIGGFAATLCFNMAYWFVCSLKLTYRFIPAVIAALLAFFVAAYGLTHLTLTVWTATLLVAVVSLLSILVMREHQPAIIANRLRMTWRVLAMRAAMAVIVVLAITGLAGAIGPKWAGLFAGFPIALLPLLIVVHLSYSAEAAATILKSFPYGLPALVIFVICAWAVFDPLGVPIGFAVSLMASLLWLTALFFLKSRLRATKGAAG